ncbi:hypothetical protein [Vibrio cholerae]|nr:hypothetical protein [Vibrio cholerae]ELJ8688263.1 hypothetical protein [Vibrio cholerae]HDZ9325807.1 hypothetical protein [Vibrio cholerae]
MRRGELTYLTDQIVTFGFSSLELRNKAIITFASGVRAELPTTLSAAQIKHWVDALQ